MTETSPPQSLPARLVTLVIARFRLPYLLLITFLLLTPALFNTFFGDDFHHSAQLGSQAGFMQNDDLSLFNLFSFVGDNDERRKMLQSYSVIPWWTGEQFSWMFWRPVTELTLYIDHVWLQYQPAMHLHGILWYLALICLVHLLMVRLFNDRGPALLATSLFALSGAHGMLVGWLCSRSPLLACFFAVLTLLAWHRSVQNKDYRFAVLAGFTLVLSLLSAEIGLSTTAWLFAYALFIDRRRLPVRLLSLAPFAVIVVIWWSVHQWGGFGINGSNDFYIQPNKQPLMFLQQLLGHIPTLLFSQWLAIPSDFLTRGTPRTIALVGGSASLLLLWLLYRRTGRRALMLFFVTGGLLSIFPLASTALQDRNVIFVSLGFAGILALAIETLWLKRQAGAGVLASLAMGLLLMLHLVWSPAVMSFMSHAPTLLAQPALRRAATLDYEPQDRIIVLGGSAMEMAYLATSLLHKNNTLPLSIWNLAGSQRHFTVDIADEHSLHLSSKHGLLNYSEQFVRNLSLEPFKAGDTLELGELDIHILTVNEGGHPTEVLYRFNYPLHEYVIFRWNWRGFNPVGLDDFPVSR